MPYCLGWASVLPPRYDLSAIARRPTTARGADETLIDRRLNRRASIVVVIDSVGILEGHYLKDLAGLLPEFRLAVFSTTDEVGRHCPDAEVIASILVHVGRRSLASPQVRQELATISGMLPGVPLAVFAEGESVEEIREALLAGARAYIPSGLALGITKEIIRLVSAGGTYAPLSFIWHASAEASAQHGKMEWPAEIMAAGMTKVSRQEFTARQLEILRCLRAGFSNKRIACQLGLCENTVKVHVRNVMKKIGAANRTQVVTMTWDTLA